VLQWCLHPEFAEPLDSEMRMSVTRIGGDHRTSV
jgi:hypothetical protein